MLQDERGFGAAEALVAMTVLAVVAMLFAPALYVSLRAAASYNAVTTATQAVSEQLSPVSARQLGCGDIRAWLAETPPPVEDSRGTVITLTRAVQGEDPTNDPAAIACEPASTLTVRVEATAPRPDGSPRVLAAATTIIRTGVAP